MRGPWAWLWLWVAATFAEPVSEIAFGGGRTLLGSYEHALVASDDGLWLPVAAINGWRNESVTNVTFVNGAGLSLGSYGEIVAEAQDYFGVLSVSAVVCEQPPSQQAAAWTAAFNALWQSTDAAYMSAVRAMIGEEQAAAQAAVDAGGSPSQGLLGLPLARWLQVPQAIEAGIYNFDHFVSASAECAQTTYTVGHALAQQQGRLAALVSDVDDARTELMQAYVMNAFADHSLTDLFSTGHLRTPRRALRDACSASIVSAAVTAMRMHNEDSQNGLPVTNQRGDRWTAWGDYFLLDAKSATNFALAAEAVHLSRSEIWQAFVDAAAAANATQLDRFGALRLAPNATLDTVCPLYRESDDGVLYVRDPIDAIRPAAYWNSTGNFTACVGSSACRTCRPCGERVFVSGVDCFGVDSTILSTLDMIFSAPTLAYDPCQAGYVSSDGSLLANGATRTTSPIPLLAFAFAFTTIALFH